MTISCIKLTVLFALVTLTLTPNHAFANLITYEFTSEKRDHEDSLPHVADELYTQDEWNLLGSITIDTEVTSAEDNQSIYLGASIIDATLSINGYSLGDFREASFVVVYFDSIAENEYPYALDLTLYFDENVDFGEIYLGYYTEDIGWSGPSFNGVNSRDANEVMSILNHDQYQELWISGRNKEDTEQGSAQMRMTSGMNIVAQEVPITGTLYLLFTGLYVLRKCRTRSEEPIRQKLT